MGGKFLTERKTKSEKNEYLTEEFSWKSIIIHLVKGRWTNLGGALAMSRH